MPAIAAPGATDSYFVYVLKMEFVSKTKSGLEYF